MAKQQNLIMGLVLGGCIAAVACGSSGDDSSSSTGGHGGSAGSAGSHAGGTSSGGTHAGGSGGASVGGSSGSSAIAGSSGSGEAGASEAGAGGEAGGGGGFVIPKALDPEVVVVPSAAPATPNHFLVGGTDFATTEVVSVTLQPAAVGDTTTYADGNAVPVSSGGLGFVLERTNDKVDLLNGGKIQTTFDMTDPGTATTALPDNKAYVALYNQSLISILDLTAGKVSRRIDLSQFNDPTDTDGSADIIAGAYDPTKKVAYFVLTRIDRNAIAADPNFHLPCSTTRGLVVGIDTTTDAIVDLNGATAGLTLPISLVGTTAATLAADGKSLTMLASGCYEGDTLKNQGVEVLDLGQGTSKIAYAPTGTDFLANLILVGGNNALLDSFDDLGTESWNQLNLGSGTLGAALTGVPSSPTYDGTDLLGVSVTGKVGSVVRYSIGAGTSTPITATSWTGQYDTTAGTALVQ